MDEHMETTVASPSVRDLEAAVSFLLQHNFDADTKVCLVTLVKMLDNLLHKPGDTKVRTIRLHNATFQQKVGSRKGGVEVLVACGFERVTASASLLSGEEEQLVLVNEEQSHLLTARRLLTMRAVQDLGMTPKELPVFRPPPALVSTTASTTAGTSSSTAAGTISDGFNPYATHRFDAKSAAAGQNLGPDSNYVSKTESALQRLQQRQAALEQELHTVENPEWSAYAPHQPVVVAPSNSTIPAKSDAGLLAEKLQKQQQERLQREQGGFTTKAMRDLEKLKKQKVYAHATLTIQFPDGFKLVGKFLPNARIGNVKIAMQTDCLLLDDTQAFDLYVTPPRRLLGDQQTLQEEGLVPAAKIFVSWKGVAPPVTQQYLQPSLFLAAAAPQVFPQGKPVVAAAATSASTSTQNDDDDDGDKKPAAETREEALMRRMMGGKSGLAGGSSSKPTGKGGTGKKPKWFQSK
jgi:hypothetical protein